VSFGYFTMVWMICASVGDDILTVLSLTDCLGVVSSSIALISICVDTLFMVAR
jgi:hypothetical protein